ncbi:MAG: hypothetical protein IID33_05400 [Planctomycetes bacterium]|nr:hypothetical protein [Planctomycetota bacterium]
MPLETLLFWIFAFSGSLLAGWWLTMRPESTARRHSPTPTAILLLIMAVLLCLLVLSGTSAGGLRGGIYHTLLLAGSAGTHAH